MNNVYNPQPYKSVYKITKETRDMAAITGDVSYTGAGFKPRGVLVIAAITAGTNLVVGVVDTALTQGSLATYTAGVNKYISTLLIDLETGAGNNQQGSLVSLDADGVTIHWVKNGLPTGTLAIIFFYFK